MRVKQLDDLFITDCARCTRQSYSMIDMRRRRSLNSHTGCGIEAAPKRSLRFQSDTAPIVHVTVGIVQAVPMRAVACTPGAKKTWTINFILIFLDDTISGSLNTTLSQCRNTYVILLDLLSDVSQIFLTVHTTSNAQLLSPTGITISFYGYFPDNGTERKYVFI